MAGYSRLGKGLPRQEQMAKCCSRVAWPEIPSDTAEHAESALGEKLTEIFNER